MAFDQCPPGLSPPDQALAFFGAGYAQLTHPSIAVK